MTTGQDIATLFSGRTFSDPAEATEWLARQIDAAIRNERLGIVTVPGTIAWACEQLLAGHLIRREGRYTDLALRNGQISEPYRFEHGIEWGGIVLYAEDLTATDWKIVK